MNRYLVWARAALIRAIRTGAQAALGFIGASTLLAEVDWAVILSGSAMAMLASILTSLAGLPEADDGTSPITPRGGDNGQSAIFIVLIVIMVIVLVLALNGRV